MSNKKDKIEKLRAIAKGKIKPLDAGDVPALFFWKNLRNGFYQCEMPGFQHLIFTSDQLKAFSEKTGGNHLIWVVTNEEIESGLYPDYKQKNFPASDEENVKANQ